MASATWKLFLAGIFFSCAFACPPKELIEPCSCDHDLIVCQNIVGQDILEGIFQRLDGTKLTDFILTDSRIDYIPLSLIEDNGIETIEVDDSYITQLFERDPSTINELRFLSFKNVTVRKDLFVASQLKPLQQLTSLGVKDMYIRVIKPELSSSPKLKSVVIENIKTRSIEIDFAEKSELVDLTINKASLATLKRSYFPFPANHLIFLSFNSNQIKTLPDDLFVSMNGLRGVSLMGNQISQVSEKVFGAVFDHLEMLNILENPIKCDCSIKWLTMRNKAGKDIAGKCVEPQSLAGRDIAQLKPSDFSDC